MLLKVKVYDSPSQENMEKELCKEKNGRFTINEISLKIAIDYGSFDALMHLSHQLVDHAIGF
jgi:hypothetical protein